MQVKQDLKMLFLVRVVGTCVGNVKALPSQQQRAPCSFFLVFSPIFTKATSLFHLSHVTLCMGKFS